MVGAELLGERDGRIGVVAQGEGDSCAEWDGMGRGISHSLKWGYIGDYRDILYGSVMEMEMDIGWLAGRRWRWREDFWVFGGFWGFWRGEGGDARNIFSGVE
jgi:hypothetical protein